jgi:hypothetical protein
VKGAYEGGKVLTSRPDQLLPPLLLLLPPPPLPPRMMLLPPLHDISIEDAERNSDMWFSFKSTNQRTSATSVVLPNMPRFMIAVIVCAVFFIAAVSCDSDAPPDPPRSPSASDACVLITVLLIFHNESIGTPSTPP